MKNTIVANAQDGIKITNDNLSRFNKRLHKAMKEEGLDVSYTLASNLLAKAFGKRNTHELLEVLNTSYQPNLQENEEVYQSTKTVDMTRTYFDYDGNQVELLAKVFFLNMNKNNLLDFYGRITFIKDVGSLPGTFKFKIEHLIKANVIVDYIQFEDFKANKPKECLKVFEELFKDEDDNTKIRLERDLMLLWHVREGEYYELYSSKEFENIIELDDLGYFQESYVYMNKKDYKNAIAAQSSESDYIFSPLKIGDKFRGFSENNMDFSNCKVYRTIGEALSMDSFGVVIPILMPYGKTPLDKHKIYSYMIITKESEDANKLKAAAIYNSVFDMNVVDNLKSVDDLVAFTRGYIFKEKFKCPVNKKESFFYKKGINFMGA